jgi:transcriptional regulator with XRE-family HTH domain
MFISSLNLPQASQLLGMTKERVVLPFGFYFNSSCQILQFAIPSLQSAIDMKLSDKLKYLREVEGSLRGLGRAMTQQELVRAIAAEMDSPLSQSYLSQIESGARPHLTNTTRLLLAKFFKVHPGYLVDDPEGYHAELLSDIRTQEEKLDLWLIAGSDRFRKDPELCRALRAVALYQDSRRSLLLLESILETPVLMERLLEILRPSEPPAMTPPAATTPQPHLNPGKRHTTRNSEK